MIYRGFNQIELNKITEILEGNHVQFHVSIPQESMEYMEDKSKRVNHRFMDNLLQIDIEREEFQKISAQDLAKLFDLRVYPEEESPFTEEELAQLGEESSGPASRKPDQHSKTNQLAAILAVAVVSLFFLWKNGFFK